MTGPDLARLLLAQEGLEADFIAAHEDIAGVPPPGVIVLAIGSAPEMWERFRESPESTDDKPSPLDRWSRRIIVGIAEQCDASGTVFPFEGPPYAPFLSWAKASGRLWPSPVGMSVHARFGLWYSCRGALLFSDTELTRKPPPSVRPCNTCAGQPCVSACPVDAFSEGFYDSERCSRHVRSPEGLDCRMNGCLARRACPVGTEFRQSPDRASFHMHAFLKLQKQESGRPD